MLKEEMRQTLNNLVLPDASKMEPDDLIVRYNNLLDFMNVRSSTDLMTLRDVIDEIYKKESAKQTADENLLFQSIMNCDGAKRESIYNDTEARRHELMCRLIPFAYYLRKKAIVREKWEHSYVPMKAGNAFREVLETVNKYKIRNICSSFVMVKSINFYEMIYGDVRNIIVGLTSTIKYSLHDVISRKTQDSLDELLLQLAEMLRNAPPVKENENAELFPQDRRRQNSNTLQALIDGSLDKEFEKIEKVAEELDKTHTAYMICIGTSQNVRCLAGGNRDEIIEMILLIIQRILACGDEQYNTFNKIAYTIKRIYGGITDTEAKQYQGGKVEHEYYY